MVNNTVVEPRVAGIRLTDGATSNILFNNLVVGSRTIIDEVGGNSIDSVSNLTRSSTDGLFANPSAGDYRLSAGSPAIDAGQPSYLGRNAPGADFEGTVRPQGSGFDVGADEAGRSAALPVPTGPEAFPRLAPQLLLDPSPQAARPLGVTVSGGQAAVALGFVELADQVDLYVAVQLPDGQILLLNSSGQWVSYPASIVPWRAHSALAVHSTRWTGPVGLLPPGTYRAYVVVVPAGTDPATLDFATSPYYLWCFVWTRP